LGRGQGGKTKFADVRGAAAFAPEGAGEFLTEPERETEFFGASLRLQRRDEPKQRGAHAAAVAAERDEGVTEVADFRDELVVVHEDAGGLAVFFRGGRLTFFNASVNCGLSSWSRMPML